MTFLKVKKTFRMELTKSLDNLAKFLLLPKNWIKITSKLPQSKDKGELSLKTKSVLDMLSKIMKRLRSCMIKSNKIRIRSITNTKSPSLSIWRL